MDIDILMAADRVYLPYLAAGFASVLANSAEDERIKLYLAVFAGELSGEEIAQLQQLRGIKDFSLRVLEIPRAEVAGFFESVHTLNMYLRLFVPDILSDLDRIIYLDCDMLVLGSLRELALCDLGSAVLGATLDSNVIVQGGEDREYVTRISTQYFNSGMLVMNLQEMRRDGFTRKIQTWLQRAGELKFPDQDALNTLYKERTKILPLRYNAQYPLLALLGTSAFPLNHSAAAEIRNPVIVHFCTAQKPWLYLPEPPYKQDYTYYLSLTPWKGLRPADRTLLNILRKALRRLRFRCVRK